MSRQSASGGKTHDLTQGSIFGGLFLFALPLLGSSLIQQMYSTVDLMFVGNLLDKDASAAVGSTAILTILIVGFFNGMGVGVGVIVAQSFGARRLNEVGETIHTAAGLACIGAVAVTFCGWLAAPWMLRGMGIPKDILSLSLTYIRIYFLSIPSIVCFNISSGILRSLGNSRSPMLCQLFGGFANIFGNTLFIYWLQLGVAGAALSTMLSQSVAAFLTVGHLLRLPEEYRLRFGRIRVLQKTARRIFFIGIPEAVRSTLITFANLILQTQINALGVDSMAAYAAYGRAEGFLYLPQWAVGQANTTFTGQNLGAGKLERARRGTMVSLMSAVGITVSISTVILLFPYQTFRIFSKDPDIVALSVRTAAGTFPLYFLYAFVEVLSGAIRGAGKSTPPMVVALINLCIVRLIVLRVLLLFFHTVYELAVVFPITWLSTALSIWLYYRSGRWRPLSADRDI